MLIELCPVEGRREPYFKKVLAETNPVCSGEVCSGEDKGEWQFEHYKYPPIKTYRDPASLIQAHLRGEYAKPHIGAPVPTHCSDLPSCGDIMHNNDMLLGPDVDLYNISEHDRHCRQTKVDHLLNKLHDANGGREEPFIYMCEPLPTILQPIEIKKECKSVGVIRNSQFLLSD